MYNEEKAIAHIRASLPEEISAKLDDDEFINVIDIIFDYYEDNGLLDVGCDESEDDEDNIISGLISHVKKMLSKDPYSQIPPEHIDRIVEAELDYEDSIFDDL